jgi:hypothetical protein
MRSGSLNEASQDAGYALDRGGRAVARLEWRGAPGASVGWYLRRRARPARRLPVELELDASVDDPRVDGPSWLELTQAAAALSLPLAIDAADRALRRGLPRERSHPLAPGVYELHVAGVDCALLSLACPSLRVTRAGDTSLAGGQLDDEAIGTIVRRLNLLGGRVLAIFRHPSRVRTEA